VKPVIGSMGEKNFPPAASRVPEPTSSLHVTTLTIYLLPLNILQNINGIYSASEPDGVKNTPVPSGKL
jgi:hypothetical protein